MAKKLKAMTFPATVSILGTPWRIEVRDRMKDKDLKDSHADGYSSFPERLIVIADLSIDPIFSEDEQGFIDELMKRCLRHEIVHAFLDESGLCHDASRFSGPWPKNEEMVDWVALQGPKIARAWHECGIFESF